MHAALLIKAVCVALDEFASLGLAAANRSILDCLPPFQTGQGIVQAFGLPVLVSRCQWERFGKAETWHKVLSEVVPRLEASCKSLLAGGGPLQNSSFNEVALAAVS